MLAAFFDPMLALLTEHYHSNNLNYLCVQVWYLLNNIVLVKIYTLCKIYHLKYIGINKCKN